MPVTVWTRAPDCVRYSKTQADHSGYADRQSRIDHFLRAQVLHLLRVKYLYSQDVDQWTRGPDRVILYRRVREKQFCGNPLNSRQIDGLLILLNVRLHLSAGINMLISLTKRSACRRDSVRFPSKVINKVTNCRWSLHQGRRR